MTRSLVDRLDAVDLVFIGYVIGLAVYAWALDTEKQAMDEQEVILSEEYLRRLEEGETVRVDRWHGHSVELRADLVVDASEVEAESDTESAE